MKSCYEKHEVNAFDDFINTFMKVDSFIEEFDEELWLATVDKVIIDKKGTLKFIFRSGTEINVKEESYKKVEHTKM